MVKITDDEIKMLIESYKDKDGEDKPIYSLKELVQYGLMYIYGEKHYKDGKIIPCSSPFTPFSEHICPVTSKIKFLEILEIEKLGMTSSAMHSCWAGYNLAIINSSNTLQAYFKNELLFSKDFSDISALNATTNIIYMGQKNGNVIYFDPVGQTTVSKQIFNDAVTYLGMIKNNLISSSLDGNIFFKRRIKISDFGISCVKYVNDDTFICADTNNQIILYRDEIINQFKEHNSEIKSLTYETCAVSTDANGMMGILKNIGVNSTPEFNLVNLGCSMHVNILKDRILGYGMVGMKIYDLLSENVTMDFSESSQIVRYKNNIITYVKGKNVHFKDIRSNDDFSISVDSEITDLSFSANGNMLLVSTSNNPFLLDLKYL